MVAIVVKPKSSTEVNQLVSLLHSQGSINVFNGKQVGEGNYKIRVGGNVLYWDHNNKFATDLHDSEVVNDIVQEATVLTVNELGTYLNWW